MDTFFELGINGSRLRLVIFHKMSPRTHHNYLQQNHTVQFGIFMDEGKVNFYKKKKRERERAGQYQVIRPKKLVVNKGFIAQPELEFFSCRTNAKDTKKARWAHLDHSSSQSGHRNHLILIQPFLIK